MNMKKVVALCLLIFICSISLVAELPQDKNYGVMFDLKMSDIVQNEYRFSKESDGSGDVPSGIELALDTDNKARNTADSLYVYFHLYPVWGNVDIQLWASPLVGKSHSESLDYTVNVMEEDSNIKDVQSDSTVVIIHPYKTGDGPISKGYKLNIETAAVDKFATDVYSGKIYLGVVGGDV